LLRYRIKEKTAVMPEKNGFSICVLIGSDLTSISSMGNNELSARPKEQKADVREWPLSG
jgi:hypothetical protein